MSFYAFNMPSIVRKSSSNLSYAEFHFLVCLLAVPSMQTMTVHDIYALFSLLYALYQYVEKCKTKTKHLQVGRMGRKLNSYKLKIRFPPYQTATLLYQTCHSLSTQLITVCECSKQGYRLYLLSLGSFWHIHSIRTFTFNCLKSHSGWCLILLFMYTLDISTICMHDSVIIYI